MTDPRAAVQDSFAIAKWLARELNDLSIDATLRNRLAGGCFSVTQDHQCAITLLLDEKMFASAFALLRPLYESYIRGLWLAHCATEEHVERFKQADEPPKIAAMLAAIEGLDAYSAGTLSRFKAESWSAMCSYTHTGSRQVLRWQTEAAIEPNYPPEEICEVAKASTSYALLSAVGMANLAEDEPLAHKILERMKQWTP